MCCGYQGRRPSSGRGLGWGWVVGQEAAELLHGSSRSRECRPDQRKSRLTSGDRGVTNSYEADKCDSALTTDCEADAVIDVVKHQITDAEVVEQVPPSLSLLFSFFRSTCTQT